jgi:GntR family transcriptional regulator/MocR family aminotransferase
VTSPARFTPLEVHISLVGRKNLTREIYRQLLEAIRAGRLRPGDRLPPTRELAKRLGVSRTTVATVYDRLAGESVLTPRVGAGTFVSEGAAKAAAPAEVAGHALRPRPAWSGVPGRTVGNLYRTAVEFDFRTGVPDVTSFPFAIWRSLIGREIRAGAEGVGVYGDPAGHRGLREAIARHVGTSRGVHALAGDITVTNGTQQALDIIARILIGPGDVVAVEDPGYPPAWRLFEALGAKVAAVPVDGQGLCVDALSPDTRLVYVSPSHQFPLGVSMSLARRKALLEWADTHEAAIVEDDYDSEFRFGDRPIEPLQTLDTAGRVIYVGSFSKTMMPSLRLGFVVAPPSLGDAMSAAKYLADWQSPLATQAALSHFIDGGWFARHIRKMRRIYQARHGKIADVLTADFAGRLDLVPSTVGLHVSAVAPGASPDQLHAVAGRASTIGVAVHQLANYSVGARRHAGLIFGYGAIPTESIEEGLHRLRGCFDDRIGG